MFFSLIKKLVFNDSPINYLSRNGFSQIRSFGGGGFRTVFAPKTPNSEKKIAIKIIPKHKSRKIEEIAWPHFKHPEILSFSIKFPFHDSNKTPINYLIRNGFSHIRSLGEGGFGTVFSAKTQNSETEIAIKIIPKHKSWRIEEIAWPHFKHPHILPLLSTLRPFDIDYIFYITPKHPDTIYNITIAPEFKQDKNAIARIKKWFQEILSAVDYLHRSKFCHLDIKSDNILISKEDSAILFDFSAINLTQTPLERLCTPKPYRPPEYFNSRPNVEGSAFDIWSFGLLALAILTNHSIIAILNKKKELITWETLEPAYTEALQEINFNTHFNKIFQHTSDQDCIHALDFVRSLLKIDPKQRPSATEALKHPFLLTDNSI